MGVFRKEPELVVEMDSRNNRARFDCVTKAKPHKAGFPEDWSVGATTGLGMMGYPCFLLKVQTCF